MTCRSLRDTVPKPENRDGDLVDELGHRLVQPVSWISVLVLSVDDRVVDLHHGHLGDQLTKAGALFSRTSSTTSY